MKTLRLTCLRGEEENRAFHQPPNRDIRWEINTESLRIKWSELRQRLVHKFPGSGQHTGCTKEGLYCGLRRSYHVMSCLNNGTLILHSCWISYYYYYYSLVVKPCRGFDLLKDVPLFIPTQRFFLPSTNSKLHDLQFIITPIFIVAAKSCL